MSADKTEDKPKTDQQKAQDFEVRYEQLCDELKMRVVASPVWVATNHGSFEMTVQMSIGKLPQGQ